MTLYRRKAATPYVPSARPGTKLSRKCERCGAAPGTRCWRLRVGKGEDDGVNRVPLERQATFHAER